jgi:hypothetical protein
MGKVYSARDAATRDKQIAHPPERFRDLARREYYVHTYAHLLSDLDVVEGLK